MKLLCSVLVFFAPLLAIASADGGAPSIRDESLRRCIGEFGAKYGWSRPEQYTELKCHGKKIRSVEGLDHYSQLVSLSLFNNQIAEFSGVHFPKLKHLNLSRNTLTKLVLSEQLQLEALLVFGNRLTAVVLNTLPNLTLLKAGNNKLKRLQYSGLPVLGKVYLFDNQIEDVDIHSLPGLTYMDVRQNPVSTILSDQMDKMQGVIILHDGNLENWNW